MYDREPLGSYGGFSFYADKDYVFRKNGENLERISVRMLPAEIRENLEIYWSTMDNSSDGAHCESPSSDSV